MGDLETHFSGPAFPLHHTLLGSSLRRTLGCFCWRKVQDRRHLLLIGCDMEASCAAAFFPFRPLWHLRVLLCCTLVPDKSTPTSTLSVLVGWEHSAVFTERVLSRMLSTDAHWQWYANIIHGVLVWGISLVVCFCLWAEHLRPVPVQQWASAAFRRPPQRSGQDLSGRAAFPAGHHGRRCWMLCESQTRKPTCTHTK